MDDLFDLSGRTVVVTGGLGLLGRSFARALAERGARVAVLDRLAEGDATARAEAGRLDDLVAEGRVCLLGTDVTDRPAVEAALARIRERWDVPSGLVNAAALDSPPDAPAGENGPFEDYEPESLREVMDVNVAGTIVPCQVFGGAMAKNGGGSVVNIGSIYGLVSPDQSLYAYRRRKGEAFYKPIAYSASKSALVNATRYMAAYWAQRGVRVNLLTLAGVFNHQDPEFLEAYCGRIPVGRMALPEDYLGPLIYLLSDASRYMIGANMVVDGGWTAI